jgi:hypothetical protein
MFAFLILLLQQVMAILGFKGNKNKANHSSPKPEPGIDLEPGLHAGLRHRIQPFTVEIHQFR